jgi:hypothetical protein
MNSEGDAPDTFDVKIMGPQGVISCKIDVVYDPSISMTLSMASDGTPVFHGNDLFECMKSLRRHLEARSMLLLCNGARVDTYPSQIGRQMGQARRVHITSLGRSTTREDQVDIFAEAPADKIGSVDAQKVYHDDWLRSLGWDI